MRDSRRRGGNRLPGFSPTNESSEDLPPRWFRIQVLSASAWYGRQLAYQRSDFKVFIDRVIAQQMFHDFLFQVMSNACLLAVRIGAMPIERRWP